MKTKRSGTNKVLIRRTHINSFEFSLKNQYEKANQDRKCVFDYSHNILHHECMDVIQVFLKCRRKPGWTIQRSLI